MSTELTKNTINKGNKGHGHGGGPAIQPLPASDKATFNGSYNLKPSNGITLMNAKADDDSDDDEEEEQADHTFEFTTNLNVFRFIRMIITLQVIALMVDKEDMEIPVLFRLLSRGPLFYSLRFYSRPFLDLIYSIQFNQHLVPNLGIESSVAQAKQQSGIGRRMLSYVSSYGPKIEPTPVFKADVVFLPDRNWHTIQYYAHFFLGLFAVVMSFLFTFKYWEMKNYTDRFEMEAWLKRYATRKWWRVGGFNVMSAVGRGSLAAALCVFFLYALSKQFVPKGIPETEMIGGAIAIGSMFSCIITLIALFLISFANSAFQRYVSQNETYTSIIILKKCIKAKVEIGLGLMLFLFVPVLYNLCQALILVEDWDTTLASVWRRGNNHFVPCYFMAFPPFRSTRYNTPYSYISKNDTHKATTRNNDDYVVTSDTAAHKVGESCPMAYYGTSDSETASLKQATNYFKDQAILTCDSYLGIIVFTLALISLLLLLIGYFAGVYSINKTVSKDMFETRWAEEILVLAQLQAEDETKFYSDFHWWTIFKVKFVREFYVQCDNAYENFCWCMDCVLHTILDWYNILKGFMVSLMSPLTFAFHRMYISVRRLYAKYRHYRRSHKRHEEHRQKMLEEITVPTHFASQSYFYVSAGTLPGPRPHGASLAGGSQSDESHSLPTDGQGSIFTAKQSSLSMNLASNAGSSINSMDRHGGYIGVDSVHLARDNVSLGSDSVSLIRGRPDAGLTLPGTNPIIAGGFVIGPSHALMDSSEAMDLHSQSHYRYAAGSGLSSTPPTPPSMLSRFSLAIQRLFGRQPHPTSHDTAAVSAPSNEPMNQVLGAVGPDGMALPGTLTLPPQPHSPYAALPRGETFPLGADTTTENPLLLTEGASQSLVTAGGHTTLPSHPSLLGPHSTSAVEMSNLVHPLSTLSHPVNPAMGAGGGAVHTIPQVGQLMPIVPDSTSMTVMSKSGLLGGPSATSLSHLDQDDHHTVGEKSHASVNTTFTKNSQLDEDGDQKEEHDYSIPPPEWSATKTILRWLRWLFGAIAGPLMVAGEIMVYHEQYGLFALYDRMMLCLFPPIDYDSMNPVLAAKVRAAEEERAMRGYLWGRKEKTAAEEDRDALLSEAFDGKPALWRRNLTLHAKYLTVMKVERQMMTLMGRLVREYVTDHELTVTLFDRIVDGAGLCLLLCPFRFYRLQWLLVMLFEWGLYASLGSVLNFWTDWVSRTGVFIGICVLFYGITYLSNPYLEKKDRVLDFTGRVLICWVGIGHIICSTSPQPTAPSGKPIEHNNIPLYGRPSTQGFSFFFSLSYSGASTYFFIDMTMVIFMYTYMIYVLRLLGIFQYLHRKWHNFTFALHDHVLNFLMKKIRQTTLGFENIYVGVRLITQWDDLIAEQRRFHLMAWPRVDPPNIINTFNKLFEIKWAALWNLNIPTLRSSLGLSVLHTTVYSGDTDIARWIVYHYPQLLLAQDSSRDTPISIGLKEAAFFALESSHLNEGRLDDGTSYGDEWFNQVYPEVEDTREQVAQNGEYVKAFADTFILNARQAEFYRAHGWLDDAKPKHDPRLPKDAGPDGFSSFFKLREMEAAKLQAKQERMAAKLNASSRAGGTSAYGKSSKGGGTSMRSKSRAGSSKGGGGSVRSGVSGSRGGENNMLGILGGARAKVDKEEAKKQAKLQAKLKKQEYVSLRRKRYPEDSRDEEYEHGNHPIWAIINLHAPKATLYKENAPDPQDLHKEEEMGKVREQAAAGKKSGNINNNNGGIELHEIPLNMGANGQGPSPGPRANGPGNNDDDILPDGSLFSYEVNHVFAARAWKPVAAAPPALDPKANKKKKRRSSAAARENIAYLGHPKVDELRYGWGKEIADEEKRNLLANRDRSHENVATAVLKTNNINNNNNRRNNHGDDRSRSHWSQGGSDSGHQGPESSALAKTVGWLRQLLRLPSSGHGRDDHRGDIEANHNHNSEAKEDVFHLTREEQAKRDKELAIAWKMCKLTEFLLSREVCRLGRDMVWDVRAYKEINRMANYLQSRLIQQLALVCCFNPPKGFARYSDWARPPPQYLYDQRRVLESELRSWLRVAERVVDVPMGAMVMVADQAAALARGVVRLAKRPFVLRARRRAAERRAHHAEAELKQAILAGDVGGGGKYNQNAGLGQGSSYNHGMAAGGGGDTSAWLQEEKAEEMMELMENEAFRAHYVNPTRLFNDRVIQYLADCAVGRQFVDIIDAELSVCGREAWRAIARALRRKYVTYVVPSVFVAPKILQILHLNLSRNELDCGDAVLVADVVLYQEMLQYLDLSFNRIGARGVMRLCEVMKTSRFMRQLFLGHNRIGPASGAAIRLLLKSTKSLKVLNLAHNRLGELIRYPNKFQRERILSVASDLFVGLRSNKSLEMLDLSYNYLGPLLADHIPSAVAKHPRLFSLNISGNCLGADKGAALLFAMAGEPGGARLTEQRLRVLEELKKEDQEAKILAQEEAREAFEEQEKMMKREERRKKIRDADGQIILLPLAGAEENPSSLLEILHQATAAADKRAGKKPEASEPTSARSKSTMNDDKSGTGRSEKTGSTGMRSGRRRRRVCRLMELCMADNQLGWLAGHGLAKFIMYNNEHLTALDMSANSLGTAGQLVSSRNRN